MGTRAKLRHYPLSRLCAPCAALSRAAWQWAGSRLFNHHALFRHGMQDMAGAQPITAEVGGRIPAGASKSDAIATPMGIARLSKMMFDGVDLAPLWRELIGKYIYAHDDVAALMDLATVEQLFGNREEGLARQAEALQQCRLYRSPGIKEPALRLLAFAAAGDI